MSASYRNPFHNKHYTGSKPVIETDVKPTDYQGFQIFKHSERHFDVVCNGVLVTQMAGPNGARGFCDREHATEEAAS